MRIDEAAVHNLIRRFLASDSGATTVKYGLIAAVISAAIVTVALGVITKLTATAAGGGRAGP